MEMKKWILLLGLLSFRWGVLALKARPLTIHCRLMMGELPLQLDSLFILRGAREVKISTLRFYLSGLSVWQDQQCVWREANSYHLVDAEDSSTQWITLAKLPDTLRWNRVEMILGVDSSTEAGGVKGGDLDPLKGMYWAWQTGYIHYKLEGSSLQCGSKNHEFQFHVGGFLAPWQSTQTLRFTVKPQTDICIDFDIAEFLLHTDLQSLHHIMEPCAEAVEMAKRLPNYFRIR